MAKMHERIFGAKPATEERFPLRRRFLQTYNVSSAVDNRARRELRRRTAPINIVGEQGEMWSVWRLRLPHRTTAEDGNKQTEKYGSTHSYSTILGQVPFKLPKWRVSF